MAEPLTILLKDQAQARLAEVIDRLEHPQQLLDRIGALMERNINFRFDTKTAPDGTKWLPLAASTRAIYEEKYKGNIPGSLLQRTRHMRDSLTHDATDAFVDVGFGDIIAIYHETGTRRGLPRRQLLTDDPIAGTLGEQDRQDVLDEIELFLSQL